MRESTTPFFLIRARSLDLTMASFYEVIVRIPSDIEEHLPGIPDAFVDWIAGKEWELPECSDMDATLIDHPQLTIAEKVQREFLNEWQKIVKSEPQYFVQFEKGDRYFHLHTLVETTGMKSMVLGRYLNQIKDFMPVVSTSVCRWKYLSPVSN